MKPLDLASTLRLNRKLPKQRGMIRHTLTMIEGRIIDHTSLMGKTDLPTNTNNLVNVFTQLVAEQNDLVDGICKSNIDLHLPEKS